MEIKIRKLDYIVPLNGTFAGSKSCKTVEQEKILKFIPGSMYVVESESLSSGVMYADCFLVNTRLCLTKCTASSTRLLVHSAINYINKPNFIIKGEPLQSNSSFFLSTRVLIFISFQV